MTDMILSERDGAILTITLNQPEKRNPVSDQAMSMRCAMRSSRRMLICRCAV